MDSIKVEKVIKKTNKRRFVTILLVLVLGLFIGIVINELVFVLEQEKSIEYLLRERYCVSKVLSISKTLKFKSFKNSLISLNKSVNKKDLIIVLITSIILTSLYIIFPNDFKFFKYSCFIIILMIIAIIDYDTQYVYSITTYVGIISGIIFSILEYYLFKNSLINFWGGALVAFLVIGLISYTTKAMGEGDIEIAVFIALFLGMKNILNFIALSFIVAAIISIVLILLKKKTMKDYISFAPSLAISAYIVLVLSNIS